MSSCARTVSEGTSWGDETVPGMKEMVADVASPNLKVHLDTFHMNIEEKDQAAAIRLVGAIVAGRGADQLRLAILAPVARTTTCY